MTAWGQSVGRLTLKPGVVPRVRQTGAYCAEVIERFLATGEPAALVYESDGVPRRDDVHGSRLYFALRTHARRTEMPVLVKWRWQSGIWLERVSDEAS